MENELFWCAYINNPLKQDMAFFKQSINCVLLENLRIVLNLNMNPHCKPSCMVNWCVLSIIFRYRFWRITWMSNQSLFQSSFAFNVPPNCVQPLPPHHQPHILIVQVHSTGRTTQNISLFNLTKCSVYLSIFSILQI